MRSVTNSGAGSYHQGGNAAVEPMSPYERVNRSGADVPYQGGGTGKLRYSSSQSRAERSVEGNGRNSRNFRASAVEPVAPSEQVNVGDEDVSYQASREDNRSYKDDRRNHNGAPRRSEHGTEGGGRQQQKFRPSPGWGRKGSEGRERNSREPNRRVDSDPYIMMYGSEFQKRDYLNAVLHRDVHMSVQECNELLSNMLRQRHYRDALALVHVWEDESFWDLLISSKAVKTLTIMIDVYGKSQQLSRSFSLFQSMCRAGVEPNVITYNALIAACARCNEPDMAYEVFEDMQDHGLKADKFSYGSLIDSCAKSGQVNRAFQISKLMDDNNVQKDQTIYSALLDACGRAKQLDRAFVVFEEMKRNGVWPNMITFSVLIDTCANVREPERAFELFAEIKHWGFPKANVIVYTSLIDACSKAGWPARGELVMRSMIEAGVHPNEISFGALMDGWTRQGEIDKAFGVIYRMVHDHNVRPNAILIGGLIDACRRLREITRVKAIWALIVEYDIRPSRTYYPGLIAMATKCGDIDVASAVALHAFARGTMRRVSLRSENPTLYALACSIAYLQSVINSEELFSNEMEQLRHRLRVVFRSTAMTSDERDMISPENAFEHCIQWNNFVTKNKTNYTPQKWRGWEENNGEHKNRFKNR